MVLRPLLTAFVIGIVCSIVGVFMVLKGLVFFGNGIAHSAFAGGTLGILLGIPPLIPISIFAVSTAAGIGYINHKTKLTNETSIGIIFALSMALGIIFISLYREYNTSVSSLLFGSLSSISVDEFIASILFGVVTIFIVSIIYKPLYFITFDEELAKSNGIKTGFINYLFLFAVALAIVMSITVVGIILVMAFIVTPAAIAYQFTYKLKTMVLYSILFALIGTFFGYMVSYILNISGSATIAIILTCIFIVTMVISPKRKLKMPNIDEPLCKKCEQLVQDVHCVYCDIEKVKLDEETPEQGNNVEKKIEKN
ncbi:MAG: metal ABC transporter permease [Promethearchaeota archaeon]